MQIIRPTPALLNHNLHFNKIPSSSLAWWSSRSPAFNDLHCLSLWILEKLSACLRSLGTLAIHFLKSLFSFIQLSQPASASPFYCALDRMGHTLARGEWLWFWGPALGLWRNLLEFSFSGWWVYFCMSRFSLPLRRPPPPAAVLLLLKSILYSIMWFHCPPSHSAVVHAPF